MTKQAIEKSNSRKSEKKTPENKGDSLTLPVFSPSVYEGRQSLKVMMKDKEGKETEETLTTGKEIFSHMVKSKGFVTFDDLTEVFKMTEDELKFFLIPIISSCKKKEKTSNMTVESFQKAKEEVFSFLEKEGIAPEKPVKVSVSRKQVEISAFCLPLLGIFLSKIFQVKSLPDSVKLGYDYKRLFDRFTEKREEFHQKAENGNLLEGEITRFGDFTIFPVSHKNGKTAFYFWTIKKVDNPDPENFPDRFLVFIRSNYRKMTEEEKKTYFLVSKSPFSSCNPQELLQEVISQLKSGNFHGYEKEKGNSFSVFNYPSNKYNVDLKELIISLEETQETSFKAVDYKTEKALKDAQREQILKEDKLVSFLQDNSKQEEK